MAEVNANTLPAKTDLGSNDSAIVVDQTTNAGALVDLDVLADKVLDRITSKTFANQVGGSSAATLLAQLSTLNSNIQSRYNLHVSANIFTDAGREVLQQLYTTLDSTSFYLGYVDGGSHAMFICVKTRGHFPSFCVLL